MNAIQCYCLIILFPDILLSTEARVFFVPDSPEQILAEGNTINITCVYQGDNIPSDDVLIKRNGQDLKTFELTERGLTSAPWNKTTTGLKRNASCEDDGDYTCSYEEEVTHQNISIIRVEHSSTNLSHSGEDAVLQCEPRRCFGANNFTKEVSWSRDGKSLMADEKYMIQSGSLAIRKPDYRDLGPYQCKTTLYQGEEDKDKLMFPVLNVELQGPPKVTIEGNKDIYVCENHPVKVLCKTEGYPKPDVVWHARLENASEEIHKLQLGNQLTIETFKSSHEGNYTCIATSSMFPRVEVNDSVRILLDRKGHCVPVTESSNLPIIIGVAVGGSLVIIVVGVVLIVCFRRKAICMHNDEQTKSSPPDNKADTLKEEEGNIQLEQKSSNNQHSSALEPLLQNSTTNDNSVTTPPPKPPRTFIF